MDSRTLNKVIKLAEEEPGQLFQIKEVECRRERQEKKEEQVREVKQLLKEGLNYTEIALKMGLCRQTVKKYGTDNFQIEHASFEGILEVN